MSSLRALLFAMTFAGCAASGPTEAEPTTEVTVAQPSATTTSAPVATSEQPVTTATAADKGEACLMWHECGCNGGCVPVASPPGGLQHGAAATVLRGPHKGTAFVTREKADDGSDVLSMSSRDPKAGVHVCDARRAAPLLGYLCEVSKSGPVPHGACDAGCKE